MLASARRVATEGTGENAPAHGFCFIAGDAAKLMEVDDDGDGVIGMIGKDRFNYVKMGLAHTVHDFDAVLFDIRTGALLGGNYRILNLAQGDRSGGTRHQAASAVAQQAGGLLRHQGGRGPLRMHAETPAPLRDPQGLRPLQDAGRRAGVPVMHATARRRRSGARPPVVSNRLKKSERSYCE